ncbi:F-box protein At3g07870-like [Papaver somniferum]|uniref:F-box protein At3g07870-like n=1 Tax=Papaver somniferum TaxID=3469 RepID=UPI000E6F5BAF|nr:F-box protein At3g07870-like [Papaver somniferum]
MHWVVDSFQGQENQSSKVLLSFDTEQERFQEIPQPDEKLEKFDYKFLGIVGGCLCMLCSVWKVGFEVWVMNDYGVKASWAKSFQIDQVMSRPFNYLSSIVDLKNNEILLDDEKTDSFILYDPKLKTIRLQSIRLPEKQRYQTFAYDRRTIHVYVESLVSVNSGTRIGDAQENLDFYEALKDIEY